jgi:hypothetical protein
MKKTLMAQQKKTITGKIEDGNTSHIITGASIKIETQSVSTKNRIGRNYRKCISRYSNR